MATGFRFLQENDSGGIAVAIDVKIDQAATFDRDVCRRLQLPPSDMLRPTPLHSATCPTKTKDNELFTKGALSKPGDTEAEETIDPDNSDCEGEKMGASSETDLCLQTVRREPLFMVDYTQQADETVDSRQPIEDLVRTRLVKIPAASQQLPSKNSVTLISRKTCKLYVLIMSDVDASFVVKSASKESTTRRPLTLASSIKKGSAVMKSSHSSIAKAPEQALVSEASYKTVPQEVETKVAKSVKKTSVPVG